MVKRYDYMEEYGDGYIGESPDGDYVNHDDYVALEARVAELERDAERYRWLRRQCDDKGSRGSIIAASHYGMDWDRNIDEAMSREA